MTISRGSSSIIVNLAFAFLIVVNLSFWFHSRHVFSKWGNVPPPPSRVAAGFAGLGDAEISYRLYAFFLQNLGNVGGDFESLKAYDYDALKKWFFLTEALDERSNYVPFMAAYYFGAVEGEPEKTAQVVDYLASHGTQPYPEKWRWLAQASYLARYKENNLDKALMLANRLASLPGKRPPWAYQLPAFIQLKMGNRQAAYEIMVRMLATEGDKIHPNEVNAMKDFICNRTLEKVEAAKNPLCQSLK